MSAFKSSSLGSWFILLPPPTRLFYVYTLRVVCNFSQSETVHLVVRLDCYVL